MRKPKYLSPSGIKTFETNLDEFYLRYLAENRPDKLPQTQPMAAGSAFDAQIKSYLHRKLLGPGHRQASEYELRPLFEKQVEPHNWEWAWPVGQHIFDRYLQCGAAADMMNALQKSVGEPRFEFEVNGFVTGNLANVPVMGKPDIFFINEQGARVIYDWKVNGYCSKSAVSPKPGYIMCRDAWLSNERKPTRGAGLPHKDCYPQDYRGIKVNFQLFMESVDSDWANQLSIYSWLLGEEVGSLDLVIGIDQICGQPGDSQPWLRIASHRLRVGADYQHLLFQRVQEIWSIIESGYIFRHLTEEQSAEHGRDLDEYAKNLKSEDDLAGLGSFMNTLRRQ